MNALSLRYLIALIFTSIITNDLNACFTYNSYNFFLAIFFYSIFKEQQGLT